ncbi:MAG: hypothetical protein CMH34_06475 [Microbacterium sp.]|nr:hypothetical protein [Microbacterium sp.]
MSRVSRRAQRSIHVYSDGRTPANKLGRWIVRTFVESPHAERNQFGLGMTLVLVGGLALTTRLDGVWW